MSPPRELVDVEATSAAAGQLHVLNAPTGAWAAGIHDRKDLAAGTHVLTRRVLTLRGQSVHLVSPADRPDIHSLVAERDLIPVPNLDTPEVPS